MKQFGWEECLIEKIRKMQCRYNMSWWLVVADCVACDRPSRPAVVSRFALRVGLLV